ncbi:PIN domain-containing protein [Carnobacterium gallinarum]|uniref:PIN/TRAM domain-containing protein n=1 Tax=Carnobacterium gallinarum TaxID=2749 RepID=UPI0005568E53|nr:PIN/TRAM domain-containing protein [Carnobacterium gallinarum]
MTKRIITAVFAVIGGSIGVSLLPDVWKAFNVTNKLFNNTFTNILIGAIIFLLVSLILVKYVERGVKKAEAYLNQQSAAYLLFGSMGTIIGLLLAFLVTMPLMGLKWPVLSTTLPILIYMIFAYLGFRIGTTRREEWRKLIQPRPKKLNETEEDGKILERKYDDDFRKYKILDTSVIIDGRIYDIAKTGFIEGTLMIPNFVLMELQYIADSADSLKRVRGRRGLDILNALQKEDDIQVEMYDGDFEDITEVDSKLIKLAKLLDGVVVTNDYNLNKVSEFQNVPVLNINELANAVKPVVIPGENMTVMVVKAGTERNQGVAYLDDGTMIVVEDGQFYMNKSIEVVVTSALQTAAGRMIFAKPVHAQRGIKEKE